MFIVSESKAADAGRAIIRVDPQHIRNAGWSPGQAVKVTGATTTVALLYPGYPEDAGTARVRMDALTRHNAGASLDGKVDLEPIDLEAATALTLAPTQEMDLSGYAEAIHAAIGNRPVSPGDALHFNIMGHRVPLTVAKVAPGKAALVTATTKVVIADKPTKEIHVPDITYDDIGGLGDAVAKVRELVEAPLRHPKVFEHVGIDPPKGILLHGPPGTGKTLLAKAVANESGAAFFSINGPEILSKFHGESEENLRGVFEEARDAAPAVIFIDELDAVAPKRDESPGESERRLVAQLLTLMDGMDERGRVVVIAATNRPDSIDAALRRPGRFDREIEIGVPNEAARREILDVHTRGMPIADDVDLDDWAARTHGYVGADMAALAREGAMHAIQRILPDLQERSVVPPDVLANLTVAQEDFETAFTGLSPSAMREVLVETPKESWSDVGGLEDAKQELREAAEWPLAHADLYRHYGAHIPKGVLLHGPPGTGKTLLAKALAHEAGVNFISVKGPELLSKWVGESEKGVREIFRKARQAAPCIIFFDEIDALVPRRGQHMGDSGAGDRMVGQFLTELDGLEALRGVLVIGATNRADLLDDALLRPGRFDRIVEVPKPDKAARAAILTIHFRELPGADLVADLAERTADWSGAELAAIAQEASLAAVRKAVVEGLTDYPDIDAASVEEAFQRVAKRCGHAVDTVTATT